MYAKGVLKIYIYLLSVRNVYGQNQTGHNVESDWLRDMGRFKTCQSKSFRTVLKSLFVKTIFQNLYLVKIGPIFMALTKWCDMISQNPLENL